MRNLSFIWIIAIIMGVIDLYVFQVVKMLSQDASPRTKSYVFTAYWVISVTIIILSLIHI